MRHEVGLRIDLDDDAPRLAGKTADAQPSLPSARAVLLRRCPGVRNDARFGVLHSRHAQPRPVFAPPRFVRLSEAIMLKAALILDHNKLTRWQQRALDAAADQLDIRLVLSCTNTRNKRQYGKHFLYYVLNYVSLKNFLTTRVEFLPRGIPVVEFASVYEGSWQTVPAEVSAQLAAHGIEVVIKFGMALLRVDSCLEKFPILSFHHGDPAQFRGRPAGFYELLQKHPSVGTIVQAISNKLDAGRIWALCHSKAYYHSYKKTALGFYSNSRFLLRKALVNLQANTPIETPTEGANYRLPGNLLVARFLWLLFWRKCSRLIYGGFFEKRWNVVVYRNRDILDSGPLRTGVGQIAKPARIYNFLADPFFSGDGQRIRVEALGAATGLGDIVELDARDLQPRAVLLHGAHYSYPVSIVEDGIELLVPEVASHSSPCVYRAPFDAKSKMVLKGLEPLRIVDGTLFKKDNVFYFFCGHQSNAADCLQLYYASALDGEFLPHPLNPIVIDPSRARMGGRILARDGKLFRLGQNNCFSYGNGLAVCEITRLSPSEYEEKVVGRIAFEDACGPHTLDTFRNDCVLDFYSDRFSVLAGYRRLAPRIQRLLARRSPRPSTSIKGARPL